MNTIQIIKEIPTKAEITQFVSDFTENGNGTKFEKYATLKFLEKVVEEGLKALKNPAKDEFIKQFGGVTKADFMGVEVSLKNMTKANALKDPVYIYSDSVYNLQDEIEKLKETVKIKEDALKGMKIMEQNDGTAKKEELFEEPKEVKDDFQLTITLRK